MDYFSWLICFLVCGQSYSSFLQNLFDSQGNVKGTEKGHPGGNNFSRDSNIPDSFDESAAFFAQNRSGQTR